MIVTSWQKVYGNIYGSPSEAFKAPYASYIENLLPNPTLTYHDPGHVGQPARWHARSGP